MKTAAWWKTMRATFLEIPRVRGVASGTTWRFGPVSRLLSAGRTDFYRIGNVGTTSAAPIVPATKPHARWCAVVGGVGRRPEGRIETPLTTNSSIP